MTTTSTTGFVVDCSMTMAWFFQDEATPETNAVLARLRQDGATAPALWPLEVANVLAGGERRGRITQADTAGFLTLLRSLPITVDDETPRRAWNDILTLARAHRLTAYDAAYLELALRLGLPLATLDTDLRAAAAALGLTILSDRPGTTSPSGTPSASTTTPAWPAAARPPSSPTCSARPSSRT